MQNANIFDKSVTYARCIEPFSPKTAGAGNVRACADALSAADPTPPPCRDNFRNTRPSPHSNKIIHSLPIASFICSAPLPLPIAVLAKNLANTVPGIFVLTAPRRIATNGSTYLPASSVKSCCASCAGRMSPITTPKKLNNKRLTSSEHLRAGSGALTKATRGGAKIFRTPFLPMTCLTALAGELSKNDLPPVRVCKGGVPAPNVLTRTPEDKSALLRGIAAHVHGPTCTRFTSIMAQI